MARDTSTSKNKNRRIRQEALREQLQNQGHLQHVVEILDKLRDEDQEIEGGMVMRYKTVLDTKLKLISKYIPDLKSVDIEGNISNDSHEEWLKKLNSLDD